MDVALAGRLFGIAAVASLLPLAAFVLARRRRLGRVLVSLGRHRQHWLSVGAGLAALAVGAHRMLALGSLDLVTMSVGAGSVFMGLLPLEIREGGIVSRDNAYPWSRLVYWRWVDPSRGALELRVRLWWSRGVAVVPVPEALRDRVGQVLTDRAPAARAP